MGNTITYSGSELLNHFSETIININDVYESCLYTLQEIDYSEHFGFKFKAIDTYM